VVENGIYHHSLSRRGLDKHLYVSIHAFTFVIFFVFQTFFFVVENGIYRHFPSRRGLNKHQYVSIHAFAFVDFFCFSNFLLCGRKWDLSSFFIKKGTR